MRALVDVNVLIAMHDPHHVHHLVALESLQVLGVTVGSANHEFWPDDISLLDGKRLHAGKVLGHRQLTDVYLLALAVHHHGRLVTFDAKIPVSVVVGASTQHLVALLAP